MRSLLATVSDAIRTAAGAMSITTKSERWFDLGGDSAAGIAVNPDKALSYAPWWRGISFLSDSVAKTPIEIYQRQQASDGLGGPDATRVPATDHPAYHLLRWKPNFFQTAYQWQKLMMSWRLSRGNGYSWILRGPDMRPLQLVPLHPDCTTPVILRFDGIPTTALMPTTQIWYVTWQAGVMLRFPAEDVLHFRGLSDNGLVGYSVIHKARETLGLGLAEQTYASKFFAHGGRPSVVLMFPGQLKDEDKRNIVNQWERMHNGAESAHKTALLDRGMQLKEVSFSAEDSQLLESREFSIREVANYLGVPAHKLGDTSRQGYASLEQENLSFYTDTLSAHFVDMEQECADKLLLEEEKTEGTYCVEFADASIRSTDLTAKANFLRTATGGAPFMSVNEARGFINLNPRDDGASDKIAQALNQSRPGEPATEPAAPATPPPQPPKKKDKKDKKKALAAGVEFQHGLIAKRLVKRAANQASAAAKSVAEFCKFADGFEAANGAAYRDEFAGVEALSFAIAGKPSGCAEKLLGQVASRYRQVAEEASEKNLAAVAAAAGEELLRAFQ